MKTISNRVYAVLAPVVSFILAFFIVLPAFAVESNGDRTTLKTSETTSNVCTRIKTLSTTGKDAVSAKRTILQTDFSNRLGKISTKQTDVDKKITEARLAASTKFNDKIASLEAQTDLTDAQKTAIETYKTSVKTAEDTRKTAVDDARSAYRTGLAALIATQQQTLSNAVTAYQTAVNSAFTAAIANCTDSNGAATLATLKASIKTARETLNSKRTPDVNKAAIKQLASTRETAIKTANGTFRKTIEALTTTIKVALQTTPTPNP